MTTKSHKNEKKSKYHHHLLTIGWIIAILATLFVLWQWYQFPHEPFAVSEVRLQTKNQKKPQPRMPITEGVENSVNQ